MARPNYRITLTQEKWDEIHNPDRPDPEVSNIITEAERDPKIRADPETRTVEIDYYYGDFLSIYRNYKFFISGSANKTDWFDLYATDEFRLEEEERIEASRDLLREVDYPLNDPNASLMLPDDCGAEAGVQNILIDNDGVCLGHGHGQTEAYGALASIAENAEASFGPGGGMLFVEELPAYLQDEIDAYLASDPEAAWLPTTQSFFDKIAGDRQLGQEQRLDTMLRKARENNVKVFSIDSGECSPSIGGKPSFGEMRDANMNAFGKTVMDKAIRDNPGRKFVVFCGAAHSNTHEGGIPGFSQIYGIPAVKTRADGTIERDDEDRSLRDMPSKEEQHFIDRFLVEYERKRKTNGLPNDEAMASENFPKEIRKLAVSMAAKMKAEGRLPDFSAIEHLRRDVSPEARNEHALRRAEMLARTRDLADTIPSGRAQRASAAKEALRNGDMDRFRELVELDAEIVLVRDEDPGTKGENLLAVAVETGAREAAGYLRERMLTVLDHKITTGAPPSDEDLAEAIIIKAEQKVWEGVDGDEGDRGLEVNRKKHRKLVEKLAGDIGALPQDRKANPALIIDQLSTRLADPGNGFFKKKPNLLRKSDPDHVSINRKRAPKVWMRELAAL